MSERVSKRDLRAVAGAAARAPARAVDLSHRKSPLMIVTFLALWGLLVAAYGPRLWEVMATAETALEAAVLTAFSGMLLLFWMLAAYYTAVVVFSRIARPLSHTKAPSANARPAVAVLYATCDDFQEEAALGCLSQDYTNFHVFLLDDSASDEGRAIVDAFHGRHPGKTTVVRRADRRGFKAGNLNHALRGPAADYPLFAVIDADERIPEDFLSRTVPYMLDSSVAFVQANHSPNEDQKTLFARDLAQTIMPFWHVHCGPRNRYGFVPYVGHGALLQRHAWEEVGGFPEVATEDLTYSAALAERGMRGLFLEGVVCREDFPATYSAFKRQQERYVAGVTQALRRHLLPLLRSRRLSVVEKVDFCLWCSPLYVPALCLLFALVCSLGLAVVLGQWRPLTISLDDRTVSMGMVRALEARFAPLWSWHFQIASTLCAFSPAFAALSLGLKRKLSVVRVLFLGTAPYLSLMLVSWRGILSYVLSGKVSFVPTGHPSLLVDRAHGPRRRSATRSQRQLWSDPLLPWELVLGLVLVAASLACLNLGMVAVCACLSLGCIIELRGWESSGVRLAAAACLALVFVHVLVNGLLSAQWLALPPLVFSVHF